MDATIPYADAYQAATARSSAIRWMLDEQVLDEDALSRQFDLSDETMEAVRSGAPLLVGEDRARRMDRLVAAQSLLLDGYSSSAMASWFRARLPALQGRSASELLSGEDDATSTVLKAASAWMG